MSDYSPSIFGPEFLERQHRLYEQRQSASSPVVSKQESLKPEVGILTREYIENRTGFSLAVIFLSWETDPAGMIEFHEEMERLGEGERATAVLGSLFFDEGSLALGIFVDPSVFAEESRVVESHITTQAGVNEPKE